MKIILLILDGWGFSQVKTGNAIAHANLPVLTSLQNQYPWGLLKASGIAVGLPWAESGNSEVGHITLGSGRAVLQSMPRIIRAIQDGSFFSNRAFLEAVENVKRYSSELHLVGLLGTGSVHSYLEHLYGLLELARRQGVSSRVKLHLFLDGKDSPPFTGAKIIENLSFRLNQTKGGIIATLIGREYAMDRDYNWAKTERTFNLLVKSQGEQWSDGVRALEAYYKKGITDSEIPPTVIVNKKGGPQGFIAPHDSIIFFNYREDSMRQLVRTFALPKRVAFVPDVPSDLFIVTMTEYEPDFPCEAAFKPQFLDNTLSQVLALNKKTQLHIAETQKYAHITYFFNGMREEKYWGEKWVLIPSFDSSEFIAKPELRVPEITQMLIEALKKGEFNFFLVNFASPDVLSHTGNLSATIKACEIVDYAIGEILSELQRMESQWAFFITADHGHAEKIIDPVSGNVLTGHTSNDVPLYFIAPWIKKNSPSEERVKENPIPFGILADVAPTILELFGIPKPQEMTGSSLLLELGVRQDLHR